MHADIIEPITHLETSTSPEGWLTVEGIADVDGWEVRVRLTVDSRAGNDVGRAYPVKVTGPGGSFCEVYLAEGGELTALIWPTALAPLYAAIDRARAVR